MLSGTHRPDYDARAIAKPAVGAASGNQILLKDIANVRETAIKKPKSPGISSEGKTPTDAVTISIVKRTGGQYH